MFLEGLQTVDMIRVIVADDDSLDGAVGHLADTLQHAVAQRGCPQGIEHDHPIVGDHESGI